MSNFSFEDQLKVLVSPLANLGAGELETALSISRELGFHYADRNLKNFLSPSHPTKKMSNEDFHQLVVTQAIENRVMDKDSYLSWSQVSHQDARVEEFCSSGNRVLKMMQEKIREHQSILEDYLRVRMDEIILVGFGPQGQVILDYNGTFYAVFPKGEEIWTSIEYIKNNLVDFLEHKDLFNKHCSFPAELLFFLEVAEHMERWKANYALKALLRNPQAFAADILDRRLDWAEFMTARLALDGVLREGKDNAVILEFFDINRSIYKEDQEDFRSEFA